MRDDSQNGDATSLREPLTVYESINETVLSLVPASAVRILDIGCGNGALGAKLREERDREVVGITYSEQEAEMASCCLSQVICANLNDYDFLGLGQFHCIIMSHVLEHVYSPGHLLQRIKKALKPDSVIVVALPNILFWKQRLEFLKGRWRYQDGGIMDRTHFRFFDFQSSRDLLEQTGYKIVYTKLDGAFPLTAPIRKLVGHFANKVDRFAATRRPGLFAWQFVYQAQSVSDPLTS